MKCAVFASGGGSNFQAQLDRKAAGDLHIDFVVLVTNNSKAFACERARKHGIPIEHLPPSGFPSEEEYTARLMEVLSRSGAELLVLAGYMKKLPDAVVRKCRNRIVNIHPALLPAFGGKGMYGNHVHEAVIAYGAKVSGVTVHFVDEEYDHGPIILQETLQVLDEDTPESLAKRVLALEHAHYWRALEAIAQNRIRISNRKVTGNV